MVASSVDADEKTGRNAARPSPDLKLRALHLRMTRAWFAEGWSVGAIARTYKRSPACIIKLIREERRAGRTRMMGSAAENRGARDPRARKNRRPLSTRHCLIGAAVLAHRREQDLTMTEFGLEVGLSRVRISELEDGGYDPTLSELAAIADTLRIPLTRLIGG